MDLVEAAARSGRAAEATAHAAALDAAGVAALSPRLRLLVAGAKALAAGPDDASSLFQEAVTLPDATRWPYELARIQLAFGEHLRDTGRTSEAREQLRAAHHAFRHRQAHPWELRAATELRATGRSPGRVINGTETLTEQEREIVQLAASGLTNKEIGARLFLSHRTVGSNLYRVFPKLGVTSRAALRDALTADTEGHGDPDFRPR